MSRKNVLGTDDSDNSSTEIAVGHESTENETPPPPSDVQVVKNESTLKKVFNIIAKGNELKNQYSFLIPKLASTVLYMGKEIIRAPPLLLAHKHKHIITYVIPK